MLNAKEVKKGQKVQSTQTWRWTPVERDTMKNIGKSRLTHEGIAKLDSADETAKSFAALDAEIARQMKCAVRNFRAGKFHKAKTQVECAHNLNGGAWNLRGKFLLHCRKACIDAIGERNA